MYLVGRDAALHEAVPHPPAGHPDLIDLPAHRLDPGPGQATELPVLENHPRPGRGWRELRRPLVADVHINRSRERFIRGPDILVRPSRTGMSGPQWAVRRQEGNLMLSSD